MKMNKLCSNLDQSNPSTGGFTDDEKQTMRNNIGAAASTDVTNKSEIKVFEGSSTVHKDLMTIYEDSQTGAMAGVTFNNANSKVTMVKNPVAADAGKVLAATVPGGQIAPYYEWKSVDTVLGASVANAGKVLTVNSNGHADWQTPPANGMYIFGNNSFKTITLAQDGDYTFSSGNFGADTTITPILVPAINQFNVYGDLISMIEATVTARGRRPWYTYQSYVPAVFAIQPGAHTQFKCHGMTREQCQFLYDRQRSFINPYPGETTTPTVEFVPAS